MQTEPLTAAQARQIESELDQLLKNEGQRYARAMELASSLPDRFSSGQDAFTELRELDQLLLEIAVDHGRVKQLKEKWDKSGHTHCPAVQTTMQRLREQLESLLSAVQQAETAATTRREQLRPQLSSEMRTQQMRNAYRNAVSGR